MDLKTAAIGILIGLTIFVAGFAGFVVLYPKFIENNQAITATNTENSSKNEKAEKVEKTEKAQKAENVSEEKEESKTEVIGEDKISNKKSKKRGISEKERKERISELTSGMTIETDDMKNTTTYLYPIDVNIREAEEGIKLASMVVEDNDTNEFELLLGAFYEGDDWIFFDRIYFKADGERFSINTPHLTANNEVLMGGVREIHEIKMNKKNEDFLRKIANASNVRIRFDGQYDRERDMMPIEIEHIRNMLGLYDLVKN